MNDITSRKDIKLLIEEFYNKLLSDNKINHFFTEFRSDKSELEKHLNTIVNFWEDILFLSNKYGKNAMKPHLDLNRKITFKEPHFNIWLNHFNTSVDDNFKGEKAELAKQRAKSIATIMQIKLSKTT